MKGIYKITNKINNKCYIGKSSDIDRRWKDHQRLAFSSGHKEYNKVLYQAFRKYGLENFNFEIIEEIEDNYESLSNEKEKYWIQFYNSYQTGYNESLGGDGGSVKGHCKGEENGQAKLTLEDVIKIRQQYSQGLSKGEVYPQYKNKIGERGFSAVWTGQTWKDVMPEVYTQENKEKTSKRGMGLGSKKQRLFSEDEVRIIRKAKQEGKKRQEVYLLYGKGVSINTFKDLWDNKTYKEIV